MAFPRECGPCAGHGYYGDWVTRNPLAPFSGSYWKGDRTDTCRVCIGRGELHVEGEPENYQECKPCLGRGYVRDRKTTCPTCQGFGILTKKHVGL